jgi:imidazolonepropionase-like amidohydrolase
VTGYLLRAPVVILSDLVQPITDGAIRVTDGRIAEVGTISDIVAREGETVLEFADSTLLPGLIECHEHLSGHDRFAIGDASVNEPDIMYALVATFHARRLLDEGITTARVPGTPGHIDLHLRRAIDLGYVPGPRLVCAGKHITMTGGHGSSWGREVDGPYEAAKATREQLRAGADFIKIVASGGVGITRVGEAPVQPELSVVEMSAAVRVAHAAGKRVTAHADGEQGIENALDAGVDCIEHGIYLTVGQAQRMARDGIYLVPTLSTMRGIAHRGKEYGMPDTWIPIAEQVLEPHLASFRAALEAGVLCATGTDGFGELIEEMEIFEECGLSRLHAIGSATRVAALVIGNSREFGELGDGRSADVIAVTGNPLNELAALRRVTFAMLRGTITKQVDHP